MMPSPMRAEYHRCTSDSSASTTASPAMSNAIRMTVPPASAPPRVMALTTSPASTGLATPMTAPTTTVTRKTAIARRYGRANADTRFAVAQPTRLLPSSPSRRSELSIDQPPPPECRVMQLPNPSGVTLRG